MPELTSDDCLNEPQPTVFKKLISPIDDFVANQNDSLPKHPNQKYEYYDMLLVYYFTSEAQSLKLLVNGLLNKSLLPIKSSSCTTPVVTLLNVFLLNFFRLFFNIFYRTCLLKRFQN